MAPDRARVALVNMPFTAAERPSIQCGLLKAVLQRAGHAVDVHYLNLELAAVLGPRAYTRICNIRADQFLGDWLFSVAAFGYRPDEEAYRKVAARLDQTLADLDMTFAELCHLRNERFPQLVKEWFGAVDWSTYNVVGFSSTFEQNVASLALARTIKESHPDVMTIFGGANFEGEMGSEYVRVFDWIDYAVTGEGDLVLTRLVDAILAGASAAGMPGVVCRQDGRLVDGGPAPRVEHMDDLPDPDYDDYFSTLSRLGADRVLGRSRPTLLFESARGCWWGQKHHCTFCGLNANTMAYRSKSPERVMAELGRLTQRYDIWRFAAVDNIMDPRYVEGLCKKLAEQHLDFAFFYEVKAHMTRAQLRTMVEGGLRLMQPGIESLSTNLLKLMRKGTTRLINLRLLKWAQYYGIAVRWNMLTGFPGETIEDYASQAELIPTLYHLPPPGHVNRIWLERFSPYFFDPSFPVSNVRPWAAYQYVYPCEELTLEKTAYFFDYEMGDLVPADVEAAFVTAVEGWKKRWEREPKPLLVYARSPDGLKIFDRRDIAGERAWRIEGDDALVYEACSETFRRADQVVASLAGAGRGPVSPDGVRASLDRFCQARVMVEEDGQYLALALPLNRSW